MTDTEIIDAIRLGLSTSGKAYDVIFKQNIKSIECLSLRLGITSEDGKEALHEAITDFYLKVETGRYKIGKAKINTYIYCVTKNTLIDTIRKRKRNLYLEEDDFFFIDNQTPEKIYFAYEQEGLLQELFSLTDDVCSNLIVDHFGPNKLTYPQLATKYGYSSAESVGTTIYRCKNKLIKTLLSNKVLLGKMMDVFDFDIDKTKPSH